MIVIDRNGNKIELGSKVFWHNTGETRIRCGQVRKLNKIETWKVVTIEVEEAVWVLNSYVEKGQPTVKFTKEISESSPVLRFEELEVGV